MNILVYPTAVQGSSAAAEILAGVRYFNTTTTHPVDVIVVARGGGSTEDLWAFNDEALARAIADSDIPVVSAVGHETDFTIADFVADLRAPTPSAAAELITEAQHRAEERVDALHARLLRGVRWQAMSARQRFSRVSAASALRRVPEQIQRRTQRLDVLELRLARGTESTLQAHAGHLRSLRERMLRQDAGSRIAASRNRLLATIARLHRLAGTLNVAHRVRSERASVQLHRLAGTLCGAHRTRVDRAAARLQALSPMAVLERGYALAFATDGHLLRSVRQADAGAALTVRLFDGTVSTKIVEVQMASLPGKENA